MNWILPTIFIIVTLTVFTIVIANRMQPMSDGTATKPRPVNSGWKRIKLPNVLQAIWKGLLSLLDFLWKNVWKALAVLVAAYIAYVVISLVSISIETRNNTMPAPRAPHTVTLEDGEKSPIFRLNRGGWTAYLDPCEQILPYVIFSNKRMVNGALQFDAYQIHNTSGGSLIFSTWQEETREGGQAPDDCS